MVFGFKSLRVCVCVVCQRERETNAPTHFRTADHAPQARLALTNGQLPWERYLRLIRACERTPRER